MTESTEPHGDQAGTSHEWADDALSRRRYADFLTKYLTAKVHNAPDGQSKSFTMALDAAWGEGKSFFVERWAADLRSAHPPHPVVTFDAWTADYAADPVIAFMSAFKKALDKEVDSASVAQDLALVSKAHASLDKGFQILGRALMPAGKMIAKSLFAKYSGMAIEDLTSLLSPISTEGALDSGGAPSGATSAASAPRPIDKDLDKVFDEMLREQTDRGALIRDFREQVAWVLKALDGSGRTASPMFVFVDELDRCRPDFAIALLEGLKHIFGIDGVCFVVSVNLSQLSESVKAVYGAGFEGYGYLERFFDMRYGRPRAVGGEHSAKLLDLDAKLAPYRGRLDLGLPFQGFEGAPKPNRASTAVGWVFDSMGMDLRSQRKSFELVEACAAGMGDSTKIHLLWLTFLCAIRQSSPPAFDALASARPMQSGDFAAVVDRHLKGDITRAFVDPNTGNAFDGRNSRVEQVHLRDVLWEYYSAARRDLVAVRGELRSPNQYRYPEAVKDSIANELPPSRQAGLRYPSSLAGYYALVRTAGHLLDDERSEGPTSDSPLWP